MNELLYCMNATVRMLNVNKFKFGSYSFTLWQMLLAFAALTLVMWFVRQVFTKD